MVIYSKLSLLINLITFFLKNSLLDILINRGYFTQDCAMNYPCFKKQKDKVHDFNLFSPHIYFYSMN